jgi:flagellar hook assembly protein FlgD
LKWTLPSPLAIGTYELTYQAQVNSLVAGGAVTNNAQLTSGAAAPINSSVPVQIEGLYTVSINVYNSAGEVVKTIPVKSYSEPINGIILSTSNLITTLQGPGSTIEIFYNGTLIGTWDGSNNSGNPVTNGNYVIKVDSTSSTGSVTTVAQDATVNRQLSNITATIYNSAGEVVRTLYNVVLDGNNSQMTNVNLSSTVIQPGSTSTTASTLQIIVMNSGSPVTLTWDGTNNQGTVVTPGSYTVQLNWDDGQGQTTDISRTVIVTGGGGATGTVLAEPNVLEPSQTLTTTFNGTGVTNAWTVNVKIYTIAGQMVTSLQGAPGMQSAQWTATGIASGLYFAVVEVQDANGGVIEHQTLKLLVLH